jgi:hypothetical protein
MMINPRSTALEVNTLTITPPMGLTLIEMMINPRSTSTRSKHANHYTTDGVNSHRNDDKPMIYALEVSTLTITPMGLTLIEMTINPRSTALEVNMLTITPPMGLTLIEMTITLTWMKQKSQSMIVMN